MCSLNGRCFMFCSKKPDPAVFTWQAQGSVAASSDAGRASKAPFAWAQSVSSTGFLNNSAYFFSHR